MLSPHSHMKIRVMPKTTESIRNLCKSTLYLFLTFVSPFILYRCIRFLSMYSSSSTSAPKTDAEILRRKRIEKSKLYFDITTPKVPPLAILPNWLVRMKVLSPFRRQVGGTILAAKLAKEQGWAINVGGGFHHCSSGRGGGFCAYADISLCIHFAFFRFTISRVMIIDLDAHQGNGHEMDFAGDGRVYILDMYNPDIYPFDLTARNYIKQKVEVATGTTTDGYLKELDKALRVARDNFAPELIIYNAGTDILDGDPLGGLKISPDGVAQRDEKVFRFARERNIPLVMVTSGGYMKTSARVVADSIINLSRKRLIDLSPRYGRR
ncbi:histone deacetylase 2-like isoform X3 [Durio zibethinus]|uniref:Histone deacetylase 2-like isoform X3 n=1 Tax=Durio zibethinus TaxID=66656 RepID=A0A6P5XWJ5_DURZI|nr:histone deacetylase 2-like isoform X3 [Durio zibethinus]